MLYIIRNGKLNGPYAEQDVARFVEAGKILLQDKARDASGGDENTVAFFLRRSGILVRIPHDGSVWEQLRRIGFGLILPLREMRSAHWLSDKRLLVVSLVGLIPTLLMMLPLDGLAGFYFIALYFSAIWGVFFYYWFRTPQVSVRATLCVFFLTPVLIYLVWDVLHLQKLNFFYGMLNCSFPWNMPGYILGVGLVEEAVKLAPLLILCARTREPLLPQTLVFYGLISGIAFGVYEGVEYQITLNARLSYDQSFFYNIARLTCLPFIHAIWCAIAGYFLAFARLYPLQRRGLLLLALGIPAILHGLYDSLCSFSMLLAVLVAFIAVLLLVAYLSKSRDYQDSLRS